MFTVHQKKQDQMHARPPTNGTRPGDDHRMPVVANNGTRPQRDGDDDRMPPPMTPHGTRPQRDGDDRMTQPMMTGTRPSLSTDSTKPTPHNDNRHDADNDDDDDQEEHRNEDHNNDDHSKNKEAHTTHPSHAGKSEASRAATTTRVSAKK
jgi:hypothetical protein